MSDLYSSEEFTVEATETHHRQVREVAASLREDTDLIPPVGLVLSKGLESLSPELTDEKRWTLDSLPHVPGSVDEDTERTIAIGRHGEVSIAVLEGSRSIDEGFSAREVVFPVRVLAELGVRTLLFGTSASGVHAELTPSDLFLVTDHINFQGTNPLVGPNVDAWGPRFPDMSEAYDAQLRRIAERTALQEGIQLQKGVYFGMLSPQVRTGAENRLIRMLGADVAGAGMVLEVIAARHMNVRVAAIAVVTDRARSDEGDQGASEPAFSDAVGNARRSFRRLIGRFVTTLHQEGMLRS